MAAQDSTNLFTRKWTKTRVTSSVPVGNKRLLCGSSDVLPVADHHEGGEVKRHRAGAADIATRVSQQAKGGVFIQALPQPKRKRIAKLTSTALVSNSKAEGIIRSSRFGAPLFGTHLTSQNFREAQRIFLRDLKRIEPTIGPFQAIILFCDAHTKIFTMHSASSDIIKHREELKKEVEASEMETTASAGRQPEEGEVIMTRRGQKFARPVVKGSVDQQFEVEFIDYGDKSLVMPNDIKPLNPKLAFDVTAFQVKLIGLPTAAAKLREVLAEPVTLQILKRDGKHIFIARVVDVKGKEEGEAREKEGQKKKQDEAMARGLKKHKGDEGAATRKRLAQSTAEYNPELEEIKMKQRNLEKKLVLIKAEIELKKKNKNRLEVVAILAVLVFSYLIRYTLSLYIITQFELGGSESIFLYLSGSSNSSNLIRIIKITTLMTIIDFVENYLHFSIHFLSLISSSQTIHDATRSFRHKFS